MHNIVGFTLEPKKFDSLYCIRRECVREKDSGGDILKVSDTQVEFDDDTLVHINYLEVTNGRVGLYTYYTFLLMSCILCTRIKINKYKT